MLFVESYSCFPMPLHSIILLILGYLHCIGAVVIDSCNSTRLQNGLPETWPCEWNDGRIPYTYNFYILNPNRLVNVAYRGIRHIEHRSCLRFVEYNPKMLTRNTNVTYLFFTFSDVLERCCLPVSTYYKRRVVLLTPLCTLPVQAAHVMLHALGLIHGKGKPFPAEKAMSILKCFNTSSS